VVGLSLLGLSGTLVPSAPHLLPDHTQRRIKNNESIYAALRSILAPAQQYMSQA
jgi:hypothetical protein